MNKRALKERVSSVFFVLLLSACTQVVEKQGFDADLVDPAKIKLGITTKDEVRELLGSPSIIAPLDSSTWYYTCQKTKTEAFFEPKILEQQVMRVTFDSQERVKEIKISKGEESVTLVPNKRRTETSGYESGALRQIFGNFGRFAGKQPGSP